MSSTRLRELLNTMDTELLADDTLTEKRRIPSTGSSSAASEGSSVVIRKDNATRQQQMDRLEDIGEEENEQPLRIRTKNLDAGTDEEEDDFNDYVIEDPLPPPTELHPGKLYALYEFSGDDPSHCELDRDDAVVLLNDQDSYWWLVRKEFDGSIGFAPAECLETYQERLARLNCWKNEELERNSKENLEEFATKTKSDLRLNKNVSFSEEVMITEPQQHQNYDYDSGDDHEHYLMHEHYQSDDDEDPDEEEEPARLEDEVTSDNFPVTPLIVSKNTKSALSSSTPCSLNIIESDIEESPFIQPQAFFGFNTNTSGSIGTYSPSSSEFDSPENTPPLNHFKRKPPQGTTSEEQEYVRKGNIPQSKGTRDIATSIKMLDDLINDELNTTASLESDEERDITLTYDDSDDNKLSSPIDLEDEADIPKNSSNITNSTFTNSNTSLHLTSTSTSVDNDSDTETGDTNSNNFNTSIKTIQASSSSLISNGDIHPEIETIFKDSLTKMDELTEKLRLLNSQYS